MISLNEVKVEYGTRTLFDDVSLRISGKDRVSFVGSNGAGKSTLLKVISGEIEPDGGEVAVSNHTTVGYLPQEGIHLTGNTLYDEVYSAAGDINKIQAELEEVEKEMDSFEDMGSEEHMDLINEYTELQERFHLLEGHRLKAKIERILIGLGFSDEDSGRMTDEFSGGWQMRIALAKLLLQNPSILLLDEPTNHLDIESLIWVESYLQNYQGAIVLVSHDRNFLDNITKRTIEISLGNVTEYTGNYSFYTKEKSVRKELLESRLKNQEKYIKEQERFIERFRYKDSKAKAVQSRIKMLDKMDKIELEDEESSINFRFPPATHSGKITLEIENLSKTYDGEKYVLDDIDLIIERGEKIAFVGVNGAGKSTLSRMIANMESITKGNIKHGHLVDLKFYSQNQADELDGSKEVLEIMDEAATGIIPKSLRSILGGFLFRDEDVFKKVKVLSGGEKSRLALAKMLIEPSNFLILDEPTNHLDMRSKEMLQRALKQYDGTVIIVSHDRDFLDGIVDKIIEVKDKKIRVYYGNCSEYLRVKEEENASFMAGQKSAKSKKIPKKKGAGNNSHAKSIESKNKRKEINKKMTPVKRRLESIESEIKNLETRKKEIEGIMSEPDFYEDIERSKELTGEYGEVETKLKKCNADWDRETEKLSKLETELSSI